MGAELISQLRPEEQAEAARFRLEKDRLTFVLGRLLVHRYLAQQGASPPGGWHIVRTAHGKPFVKPAPGYPVPTFNISHTAGAVMAAFATDREIGLDVESMHHQVSVEELAQSYFAAAENTLLLSFSGSKRRETFYKLWTLKEAYLKAMGRGLPAGLSHFSFRLDPPAISFSSTTDDRPDLWFFIQDQLTPALHFALAARRLPSEELSYVLTALDAEQLIRPLAPRNPG